MRFGCRILIPDIRSENTTRHTPTVCKLCKHTEQASQRIQKFMWRNWAVITCDVVDVCSLGSRKVVRNKKLFSSVFSLVRKHKRRDNSIERMLLDSAPPKRDLCQLQSVKNYPKRPGPCLQRQRISDGISFVKCTDNLAGIIADQPHDTVNRPPRYSQQRSQGL